MDKLEDVKAVRRVALKLPSNDPDGTIAVELTVEEAEKARYMALLQRRGPRDDYERGEVYGLARLKGKDVMFCYIITPRGVDGTETQDMSTFTSEDGTSGTCHDEDLCPSATVEFRYGKSKRFCDERLVRAYMKAVAEHIETGDEMGDEAGAAGLNGEVTGPNGEDARAIASDDELTPADIVTEDGGVDGDGGAQHVASLDVGGGESAPVMSMGGTSNDADEDDPATKCRALLQHRGHDELPHSYFGFGSLAGGSFVLIRNHNLRASNQPAFDCMSEDGFEMTYSAYDLKVRTLSFVTKTGCVVSDEEGTIVNFLRAVGEQQQWQARNGEMGVHLRAVIRLRPVGCERYVIGQLGGLSRDVHLNDMHVLVEGTIEDDTVTLRALTADGQSFNCPREYMVKYVNSHDSRAIENDTVERFMELG